MLNIFVVAYKIGVLKNLSNDERLLKVLEQIVSIYIETGDPVSSVAVCNRIDNSVSSATIRSDMVKLEKLGFLEQPHISAGRVPTYEGFRIYINRLMEPEYLTLQEKKEIDFVLEKDVSSINSLVDNAANALSEVTGLAVVSTSNFSKFSMISKVEVIPAGRRVFAILVVTSNGEIKNKICRVEFDIGSSQLDMFKKLLNDSLIGNTIESLDNEVIVNLSAAVGGYVLSFAPLFKALREISDEMQQNHVNLTGEDNLLKYEGVQADEILKFISVKDSIEKILSSAFSGINIVFGNESDVFKIGNSSLIVTKYGNLTRKLGCLGVIGPMRLNYRKVLAYLRYFEKGVSSLIEKMEFENEELEE